MVKDFPNPKIPNAFNYLNQPICVNYDYPVAYHKYQDALKKYEADLELYEQIKLIKLVKNSTEKYCLTKLKISRR